MSITAAISCYYLSLLYLLTMFPASVFAYTELQVTFPHGENVLRVGGRTLELLQFHFHAPSEHAFNGDRFDMEAHLVHRMLIKISQSISVLYLSVRETQDLSKVVADGMKFALDANVRNSSKHIHSTYRH